MGDAASPLSLPEGSRLLFVDWLGALCDERFGAARQGTSGDAWTIGLKDESQVAVRFGPQGEPLVEVSDQRFDPVPFVEEAHKHAVAGDFGDGQWYSLSLSCDVRLEGWAGLHMLRSMNEHRRFEGDWAFGDDCLLSFKQADTKPAPIVIPKFDLHVLYRVPSPWHGPHGNSLAEELGTFVRSAIAFASGAPFQSLAGLWPAEKEDVAAAKATLARGTRQLFVEDVPLAHALLGLARWGNREVFERAQGAIYAYEEALGQRSEFVAIILLVTAMEALAVPNAAWRKERLTKRFIEVVAQLCPDVLASILSHGNFEAAFGSYASARRFLDALYNARSRPLHTGFVQHRVTAIPGMGGDAAIRVMLVSELARAAILSFLRAPFTSLVGHPIIDPASAASVDETSA